MLQNILLTDDEKALKQEVKNFVKSDVSSELLKKMDRDEIIYPREFVKALGKCNLLGLRFSKEYGGRELNWTSEIAALEEIGVLGTARAISHAAAKAADTHLPSARRLVSEAKKFATDMCWEVCNLSMQIVGGIGYTNVFPIEKMVRDSRLAQIWTGTNEIMSLLVQHEYYKELLNDPNPPRLSENDADEAHLEDEKVYEEEEMWTKGW